MGIDIYARYNGQPSAEIAKQISSFMLSTAGDAGYLREAYHGKPYVTRYFVREAFATGSAEIPAAQLRRRLTKAVRLAEKRERVIYGTKDRQEIKDAGESYVNFVKYCEAAERQTGKPVTIIASY